MSKYKLNTSQRWAVFKAHNEKCAYCHNPVSFSEMQVDHVIPEELAARPAELSMLLSKIGKPADFDINSFLNWLPSHGSCNRNKGCNIFSDPTLLYYLEMAASCEPRVKLEYNRSLRVSRTQQHAAIVALTAEKGLLPSDELESVLRTLDGARSISLPSGLWRREQDTQELSPNEPIEHLLDTPLENSNASDSSIFLLHHESEPSIRINTIRDFVNAKKAGYYPLTKWELSRAGRAEQTATILEAVRWAVPYKHSDLRNPWKGVCDLDMLPASFLNKYLEDEHFTMTVEPTISALVEKGHFSIEKVSSSSIALLGVDTGSTYYFNELLRADLDQDGEEELLVQHSAYHCGIILSDIILLGVDPLTKKFVSKPLPFFI